MYYACDVLQDAIRCSGGSSRATAAATSAGAHSHVGGMSGISPTRPLPRNFRTFCPCNREWREEFRPWRSTVGGRTPSLRMILVRSARAAGPPPERPIALRYRGTRRPKWWPIVKSRRSSCRRSSPPASMRARSFARANCVQSLQRYVEAGATTILLRVVGYDQKGQFKRVTEEILPAFS